MPNRAIAMAKPSKETVKRLVEKLFNGIARVVNGL
jgi:hypothetical protein